jgi:hypothetical protein
MKDCPERNPKTGFANVKIINIFRMIKSVI